MRERAQADDAILSSGGTYQEGDPPQFEVPDRIVTLVLCSWSVERVCDHCKRSLLGRCMFTAHLAFITMECSGVDRGTSTGRWEEGWEEG